MNYSNYFITAPRYAGRKPIALVKGDLFTDFISELTRDASLDKEYKAFIICAISGGLRVEEALGLSKKSFDVQDDTLYFKTRVLKKRKDDSRWCRVHPSGQGLVSEVLRDKVGKLFDWTQGTALLRSKRIFNVEGICNHSFRHSAVSYYLFNENLSMEKTAKLIHVSTKIVDVYAHLDERNVLSKMFKD